MDVLEDRNFQKEVDTVRALHQTVVSLRAALERSRIEIEELKGRIWSTESCEIALQTLSVENHILRQKIISVHEFKENTTQTSIPYITVDNIANNNDKHNSKDTSFDESLKTDTNHSFVTEIQKSPRKTTDTPRTVDTPRTIDTSRTVDTPRTVDTSKTVDSSRTVDTPRTVDTSRTVDTPRTVDTSKTVDSSRTVDTPRTVDIPKTFDISRTVDIPKTVDIPRTVDTPRTVETQRTVDTPRTVEIPRTVDIPRKSPRNQPETNVQNKSPRKSSRKLNFEDISPRKNTLQVPKNEPPVKSPKKNVPSSVKTVTPRQTLITVNVTLKSPKKRKQKLEEPNNEIISTMEEETKEETQPDVEQKESDPENEEVDDIELIFTTDETTTVIKEELVSIADGNDGECDTPVLLNYKTVDFDTPDLHLSCEDKDLDDDVFHENETTDNFENENTENLNFQQIHNSKSDNSINREENHRDKSLKSCYSYQDSSFESRSLDKDESFDKFDDKEKYLHNMWSNNSVLVETDISKCGIVDPEPPISTNRRNTCPNPAPYRPIMHREAIKHNSRTFAVKFSTPRPILTEKNSPKTESEAQTDISALPNFWKSESYLAHKVQHQFTTLPSKFPMPINQKSLRLSEKTKEARRVLLSDINFTSMVPELSRSADHLYQDGQEMVQTTYGQYLNTPGPQLLRRYNTGDSLTSPNFIHSQKFTWSPSDYSNFSSTNKFDNSNMFLNRYRGSLSSINQNSFEVSDNMNKRRSYSSSQWRQNVPQSFDNSRFHHSGHGQYRSVPNSPTRSRSVPFISSYQQYGPHFKHSYSRLGKQGFGGFRYLNGSLPELHGDHDSGDSTDSLVEEAEQYLRSSIDCIVSGRDMSHTNTRRRASAPCPTRDSSPPRNWQPFLPHGIKDLRSDNWVKVIAPEGKIRGGRIRYVGYVMGQPEPYVGIELASSIGNSDGSFNNRRYFEW